MNFQSIFAFIAKLGGLALTAYGVNVNNLKDMTVGAAFAAIIHGLDSIWNSPKGTPPTP